MTLTVEQLAQRDEIIPELERLREPIARLYHGVTDLFDQCDALEWSVTMTAPEVERPHLNHAYAELRLIQDIPAFRDQLEQVLRLLDEEWGYREVGTAQPNQGGST